MRPTTKIYSFFLDLENLTILVNIFVFYFNYQFLTLLIKSLWKDCRSQLYFINPQNGDFNRVLFPTTSWLPPLLYDYTMQSAIADIRAEYSIYRLELRSPDKTAFCWWSISLQVLKWSRGIFCGFLKNSHCTGKNSWQPSLLFEPQFTPKKTESQTSEFWMKSPMPWSPSTNFGKSITRSC